MCNMRKNIQSINDITQHYTNTGLLKCHDKIITFPSTYPTSPITLFTKFLVTWASLLHCFFGPECINNWWNERIEERLQEPLVDPQQDRNHNTGNAHHDCGLDRPRRMKNLKQRKKTEIYQSSKKYNNAPSTQAFYVHIIGINKDGRLKQPSQLSIHKIIGGIQPTKW